MNVPLDAPMRCQRRQSRIRQPLDPFRRYRCGLVAIVGRPNVGKSTLLNALVGQKISITSARRRPRGTASPASARVGDTQFVFVDTPGFQTRHSTAPTARSTAPCWARWPMSTWCCFVVGRQLRADAKVLALFNPGAACRGKPVLPGGQQLDAVQRRPRCCPG